MKLRPNYRGLFLGQPKQLQIIFYTSNIDKFLQARMVLEKFGISLGHFRSRREPYDEDYSLSKQELLTSATSQVKRTIGANSLFFVEDTSVRIDALSRPGEDVPGLRIKEWFREVTFEEVDQQLRKKQNNRRAMVRSDIALHIPRLDRPVFFSGQTEGRIADILPSFFPSLQYPWLTSASFNGWLIPNGASRRLGEMDFEESWEHDFRVMALVELVTRLEEYAAILNLTAPAYRRPIIASESSAQLELFGRSPVLIVVGPTCAGKTTFGEYVSQRHGFRFIEASGVVRMLKERASDGGTVQTFAERLLTEQGADYVALQIIDLFGRDFGAGLAITGFRTVEELLCIRAWRPDAQVVLIDASERSRFERHLRRGRYQDLRTLDDFGKHDESQRRFGLLYVAEDLADIKIRNEETFERYHGDIDAVVSNSLHAANLPCRPQLRANPRRERARDGQLFRVLSQLSSTSRPLTAKEIERLTGSTGTRIRQNNVSKVLRAAPVFVRRLRGEGSQGRYEITSAGRAYVQLIEQE